VLYLHTKFDAEKNEQPVDACLARGSWQLRYERNCEIHCVSKKHPRRFSNNSGKHWRIVI